MAEQVPGPAWTWPKTLQKVGKLEKHNKSWKFLEILGNSWKIEGFPNFLIKKNGKPMVFQHLPCVMACPGPDQVQTEQIGFQNHGSYNGLAG